MWQERSVCQPASTEAASKHQKQARRGPSPGPSQGTGPLAPRAARQKVSIVLGHLVFDILLQQPSTWLTNKNIDLPHF